MSHRVIGINSNNPDYYQWGKNCQYLSYTEAEAGKVINHKGLGHEFISQEDKDLFWSGFFSEEERKINEN